MMSQQKYFTVRQVISGLYYYSVAVVGLCPTLLCYNLPTKPDKSNVSKDIITCSCSLFISLAASACEQLNQFEEAVKWCDKGLAVSFTIEALLCSS